MTDGAILEVVDLHTEIKTREGVLRPVNGVSFSVKPGKILGLVGESGAGKTMTAYSILDLVPHPGKVVGGMVLLEGKDLRGMRRNDLRRIRGKEIACCFQDARVGLNPLLTVGIQMEEMITSHLSISTREARAMTEEALGKVGMPDPRLAMTRYTFQLSGGMCQRVMLAMALVLKPKVLIADEATTGLDVTLQADILQQIRMLKELGTAILLISHDLGVTAQMADEVAVMYGGHLVERTDVVSLFKKPMHPYTWGLMRALPDISHPEVRMVPLAGSPPDILTLDDGCPFLPRCNKAVNRCRLEPMPAMQEIEPGHWVACYNYVRHQWD